MKLAVLALTKGGKHLAQKIAGEVQNCLIIESTNGIAATLKENWQRFDGFICIMATGITVRAIAPLLRDKCQDPCVVCLDEKGAHVISLLSGHLGGANSLAYTVAAITGGNPVITTSSDTLGLVALDLWAERQNLAADRQTFTRASSQLVNSGTLHIYCETEVASLPHGLKQTLDSNSADLIISNRTEYTSRLCFYPRNLVVGIGCNRNTPMEEFEVALRDLFNDIGCSIFSIRNLASIDVKNDETGLLQFAEKNRWPISFYSREQINTISNVTPSEAALKAVGAIGVAEPTALLSAATINLLSRKRKWQNITMAVAEAPFTLSEQVLDPLTT